MICHGAALASAHILHLRIVNTARCHCICIGTGLETIPRAKVLVEKAQKKIVRHPVDK